MAVKIRLMRIGKKKFPKYRVIVIEEAKKRNSNYLEKIGFYDPIANPPVFDLDQERLKYWQKNGAQLTEGLRKLLK
jgi:small subunit ribosomal protein S16